MEGCEEEVKAPVRMLLGAAAREAGREDAARPRPLQRHPPSSPRWQHQGAGGALSDREKILMRTGSAFLPAELLPRGCRLAGWGGAFERFAGKERGRWLQGSAAASPARGWSSAPSAQRRRLSLRCSFTHPGSLRLAAGVPVPGKPKHRRLREPTQTIGSKVHAAASSSSEINISAS